MTSRREIYVIETRSGKYGIRDNIKQEYLSQYSDRRKLVLDKTVLEMIGGIDEVFRMVKHFNPYVVIETNKGGTNWVRAFNIAKKDFAKPMRAFEFVARDDKVTRILDALLPYYETRSIYHGPGQGKMERQLELLKKVQHDDEADALATAVLHSRPPMEIPYPKHGTREKPKDLRQDIHRKQKKTTSYPDDWVVAVLPTA